MHNILQHPNVYGMTIIVDICLVRSFRDRIDRRIVFLLAILIHDCFP